MSKNAIPALVIAGARVNWARHYLINHGIRRNFVNIIMNNITEGDRVSGDVGYVRYIIDIMS